MTDIKTLQSAYLRAVTERDNAIFQLTRLKAERDKAVTDLCECMKEYAHTCKFCKYFDGEDINCEGNCNPDWRGLEESE